MLGEPPELLDEEVDDEELELLLLDEEVDDEELELLLLDDTPPSVPPVPVLLRSAAFGVPSPVGPS